MLSVFRTSREHHLRDRHDEGRGHCRMEQEGGAMTATYDKRYPDPSVWKVLDNMDAAQILQGILDEEDK